MNPSLLEVIRKKHLEKLDSVPLDRDAVWLYSQQILRAWYSYEEETVRPTLHCAVQLTDTDPDRIKSNGCEGTVVRHDVTVEPMTPMHALLFLLETLVGKASQPIKRPGLILCDYFDDVEYLQDTLSGYQINVRGISLGTEIMPGCVARLVDGANSTLQQYGRNDEKGLHGVAPNVAPDFFASCGQLLAATPWDIVRYGDAFSISIGGETRVFSVGVEYIDSLEDLEAYKSYLEDKCSGKSGRDGVWRLSFGSNSTFSFDDDDAWRAAFPGGGAFPQVHPMTPVTLAWFAIACGSFSSFMSDVHGKLKEMEIDHGVSKWKREVSVPVQVSKTIATGDVTMEWHGLLHAPECWLTMGPDDEEEYYTASEGSADVFYDTLECLMPLCAACSNESAFLCSRCHKQRYCSRHCQKIDWKNHKHNCL